MLSGYQSKKDPEKSRISNFFSAGTAQNLIAGSQLKSTSYFEDGRLENKNIFKFDKQEPKLKKIMLKNEKKDMKAKKDSFYTSYALKNNFFRSKVFIIGFFSVFITILSFFVILEMSDLTSIIFYNLVESESGDSEILLTRDKSTRGINIFFEYDEGTEYRKLYLSQIGEKEDQKIDTENPNVEERQELIKMAIEGDTKAREWLSSENGPTFLEILENLDFLLTTAGLIDAEVLREKMFNKEYFLAYKDLAKYLKQNPSETTDKQKQKIEIAVNSFLELEKKKLDQTKKNSTTENVSNGNEFKFENDLKNYELSSSEKEKGLYYNETLRLKLPNYTNLEVEFDRETLMGVSGRWILPVNITTDLSDGFGNLISSEDAQDLNDLFAAENVKPLNPINNNNNPKPHTDRFQDLVENGNLQGRNDLDDNIKDAHDNLPEDVKGNIKDIHDNLPDEVKDNLPNGINNAINPQNKNNQRVLQEEKPFNVNFNENLNKINADQNVKIETENSEKLKVIMIITDMANEIKSGIGRNSTLKDAFTGMDFEQYSNNEDLFADAAVISETIDSYLNLSKSFLVNINFDFILSKIGFGDVSLETAFNQTDFISFFSQIEFNESEGKFEIDSETKAPKKLFSFFEIEQILELFNRSLDQVHSRYDNVLETAKDAENSKNDLHGQIKDNENINQDQAQQIRDTNIKNLVEENVSHEAINRSVAEFWKRQYKPLLEILAPVIQRTIMGFADMNLTYRKQGTIGSPKGLYSSLLGNVVFIDRKGLTAKVTNSLELQVTSLHEQLIQILNNSNLPELMIRDFISPLIEKQMKDLGDIIRFLFEGNRGQNLFKTTPGTEKDRFEPLRSSSFPGLFSYYPLVQIFTPRKFEIYGDLADFDSKAQIFSDYVASRMPDHFFYNFFNPLKETLYFMSNLHLFLKVLLINIVIVLGLINVIIVYSLTSLAVNQKNFEYGIIRAVGLKKSGLLFLISIIILFFK